MEVPMDQLMKIGVHGVSVYQCCSKAHIVFRKYRYLAYRQMAWWGWHYLGRHRRVVLPSCVVPRIRQEFPSEMYTGHQHPPATP